MDRLNNAFARHVNDLFSSADERRFDNAANILFNCGMVKALERAIAILGGTTALSAELGESPQTVNNWRSRGVPAERCPDIERVTAKAGTRIYCEDLRPDVKWSVLRGVARQ